MAEAKEELIKMLNRALEMEHAARIQYLAHAELISGLNAEPVIERLKEIASDEQKHEEMFRDLIGGYLGGEPSMGVAKTYSVQELTKILEVNLKGEKDTIDFYRQIHKKVITAKESLPYEFEKIEHEIRHIIMDEEEHTAELTVLLGK